MRTGLVYLIHFARPYHHAQHYLGSTSRTAQQRFAEHGTQDGSRLLAAVRAAGIPFEIVRTWTEPLESVRLKERALKRLKGNTKLCPICRMQPKFTFPKGWSHSKTFAAV